MKIEERQSDEDISSHSTLEPTVFRYLVQLTHLIQNKHVTFADICDSFLHQVNDATRSSNNDMHYGKGGNYNGLAVFLCGSP